MSGGCLDRVWGVHARSLESGVCKVPKDVWDVSGGFVEDVCKVSKG